MLTQARHSLTTLVPGRNVRVQRRQHAFSLTYRRSEQEAFDIPQPGNATGAPAGPGALTTNGKTPLLEAHQARQIGKTANAARSLGEPLTISETPPASV